MSGFGESRSETGVYWLSLGNLCRLGLFVAVGAGCVFSVSVILDLGLDMGLLCLVGTAALVAVSLPLALRRSEIIEPIWLVVLTVAVGVTGKVFYICFGPEERVSFLLLDKDPSDLLLAALVIAAGLLGFSAGYLSGNVRWKLPGMERLSNEWRPRQSIAVIGILLVVGLLSFVVFASRLDTPFESLSDLSRKRFVALGSSGMEVRGYLRWGASLIESAFYLAFVNWVASKRRLRSYSGLLLIAFAPVALAFPIFVSSRQTVLIMIVRTIMIWISLRGEPRPRYVVALVTMGLVVVGAMLALRRGSSEWEGLRSHMGVSGLLEVTVGGRHFLDLTKTAHVIAAVPDKLDYQYGKTLVTWLVAPVPRSVWPDKPPIGAGGTVGPPVFGSPPGGGVPPGIVGELHLNFGIPGVFVGLIAAGFLLRSLYSTFRPHFPNKSFVLIYALLSTQLALGMVSGAVSTNMSKLLQEMVPVVLALYACGFGVSPTKENDTRRPLQDRPPDRGFSPRIDGAARPDTFG